MTEDKRRQLLAEAENLKLAAGHLTYSMERTQPLIGHPANDTGIRCDSFGFDWGLGDAVPTLFARDKAFATLAEFNSPFVEPV